VCGVYACTRDRVRLYPELKPFETQVHQNENPNSIPKFELVIIVRLYPELKPCETQLDQAVDMLKPRAKTMGEYRCVYRCVCVYRCGRVSIGVGIGVCIGVSIGVCIGLCIKG
jgi:hypothetical protein